MARRRSREAESQSVNRRMLLDAIVDTDVLKDRAVTRDKLWPDAVDNTRLAAGAVEIRHLSDGVRETLAQGRHVTVNVPAQTWDGRLDFGAAIREAGWSGYAPLSGNSDEFAAPVARTYDLHVDLDCDEQNDVTLWVEVDGETQTPTKTGNVHGEIVGVTPLGALGEGAKVTVHTDTALEVSGGVVTLQSLDRQVPPDPPTPMPDSVDADTHYTGNLTSDASQNFAVPAGTEPGDLLVLSWLDTRCESASLDTSLDFDLAVDHVESPIGTWNVAVSMWTRVAEQGDAGTTVTVNSVYNGEGSSHQVSGSLYRIPGPYTQRTGVESAAGDTRTGIDGPSPSEDGEREALVVSCFTLDDITQIAVEQAPVGAVSKITGTGDSNGDRMSHGLLFLSGPGDDASFLVVETDLTWGARWVAARMRFA